MARRRRSKPGCRTSAVRHNLGSARHPVDETGIGAVTVTPLARKTRLGVRAVARNVRGSIVEGLPLLISGSLVRAQQAEPFFPKLDQRVSDPLGPQARFVPGRLVGYW